MTAGLGGVAPLMMSPFSNPAVADGEFKALLSLVDGAPIRSRTENERMRRISFAYDVIAILLGFLAVTYLPWSARPPAGWSFTATRAPLRGSSASATVPKAPAPRRRCSR